MTKKNSEQSDIVVLNRPLTHKAPNCFASGKRWWSALVIEREEREMLFLHHFIKAFVAKCIGERRCPTPPEWANFAMAGSIVAAIAGHYVAPPPGQHFIWCPYEHVWEALWEKVRYNKSFDREFRAVALYLFLPQHHAKDGILSDSYVDSRFAQCWEGWGQPLTDGYLQSISNLRPSVLAEGRKLFGEMPEGIRDGIERVAHHTPRMIEIVNEMIAKKYSW